MDMELSAFISLGFETIPKMKLIQKCLMKIIRTTMSIIPFLAILVDFDRQLFSFNN